MKKLFALILMLALMGTAVSALAETWTCANCGKESEGNFCSWCGAARTPEKVVCPSCGAEFDPDAGFAFCNTCGAALGRKSAEEVSVGDIITFGHYEQDNDLTNGPEAIEWMVLDVQDGKALLLSRYGLDAKRYNTEWIDVTWETCTLRIWLNGTFLNEAFTAQEQKGILTTTMDNSSSQGYSGWSTNGGNNTQDRIFLLSCAEANKYLGLTWKDSNNMKSRTSPTAYALQVGALTSDFHKTADGAAAGWWWLRSPGHYQGYAASVNGGGSLISNHVNSDYGVVRPAFWLNLESGIF